MIYFNPTYIFVSCQILPATVIAYRFLMLLKLFATVVPQKLNNGVDELQCWFLACNSEKLELITTKMIRVIDQEQNEVRQHFNLDFLANLSLRGGGWNVCKMIACVLQLHREEAEVSRVSLAEEEGFL